MTMRASHVLVKFEGSRRPASWRDPEGAEIRARSRAAAEERLLALRERAAGGEDFAAIARAESDCGSAQAGGDLGEFGPGQMMRPFEDATRALAVGEMSGVVQTDSGLHIILRTG
mmetsp:Transcript_13559/g.34472  ORF Transcript_13559/g.34472 Transcript_13559/m.34472 type:complete len:115 (-) Transcript_13559:102-446(-)